MDNTSYHLKANFTLGNLSHKFSALDSSINCHVNAAGCFFDVLYLLVLCVVGTVGNLLLIFSIIHTRRVNKSGNILFIHLAGVDLLVSCYKPLLFASNESIVYKIDINKSFCLTLISNAVQCDSFVKTCALIQVVPWCLQITSFIIPIGIANLVSGKNVLSDRMCVAAGYILCLSCVCSVSTLACIAFNRYSARIRWLCCSRR